MKLNPRLRNALIIAINTTVGLASVYSVAATFKLSGLMANEQLKKLKDADKVIEKLKTELDATGNTAHHFKTQTWSLHERLNTILAKFKENNQELNSAKENISKLSKQLDGVKPDSKLYSDIMNEINLNKQITLSKIAESERMANYLEQESVQFTKDLNAHDKMIEDGLDHSEISESFFGSEILEWIDTFNGINKIGLGLIICNYTLILSLLNIVGILLGDFLIKKYNLETRYPFLAKIFAWRKKFNFYYLIFNISIIFILSLAQLVLGINFMSL